MSDITETIQSQYAAAPKIRKLIKGLGELFDRRKDIENFYTKVFDIDTCDSYGLDVWGRIVGVKRDATMVTVVGVPYFGFHNKYNKDEKGFNQKPFFHGAEEQTFVLSDDAYRLYIKAKAIANICNGSLEQLNYMLNMLLPHCDVRLTRVRAMHFRLVCSGPLTDFERTLLLSGTMPPIPTGVTFEAELNGARYFGFNETENTAFNDGPLFQRKY